MRDSATTFFLRPVALAGLALLIGGPSPAIAEGWRLTLRPEAKVPSDTPLTLPAPDGLAPGLYSLKASADSPAIPGVVSAEGGRATLSMIAPEMSGPTTFAILKATEPAAPGAGVVFRPEGPNLQIEIDGDLLGVHRVDREPKPFLHPLLGPGGVPMTRAYPMETVEGEDQDHPHQASFWFTHGKVDGIDFWSLGHGTIRETGREILATGPVRGRLQTRNDWLAPDGRKVCEDERVLTVYETAKVRILDFDLTLTASEGPVVMGETKEGSFGVRVASSMDVDRKKGGKIRNAEGLEDAEAWGKPSPWVDYSGPVGGETVGLTILNHPRSFRYPTTWHVRTYGLFAANPFGGHDFGVEGYGEHTLAKGDSMSFNYRLVLHKGGADAADLARRFALYAAPPDSSWESAD
ncbi:PmoA family protein [Planctomyces sp. SH-PL62]|uniref:DUF6807 domain-containing protein n=1 Tax=Planctomyces sp. SH-PL62 TaxID=1636152 RepID=UPI00078D574B|nr:PmoA family protein [Planctomyces sp. SH-PL62]AMV36694.1 hypothetical protein VT85_04640 [Planctomyces sp. SH-PL62]